MILCSMLIFFQALSQTATAPSGSGTVGDPYQIGTLENLYWIAASNAVVSSPTQAVRWGAQYRQTANINASETSTWFSGGGWTPIGNITVSFTGSYDGNHYTIDGLFISRSGVDMQSLFGYTVGAVFTNIGMLNVNITGQQYPTAIASLLIGSTMNNCYSTGAISGRYQTGGLVGSISTNGTISNSYSTCTVSGSLDNTGGLVGRISDGSISRSYFTGSVTNVRNYAGGLVGDCTSGTTISNSFSSGSVNGAGFVGGLAGRITSGTITNCYSTGSISGTTSVGGLIGSVSSATVSNSFWDTQTSGQSVSAAGTGKTTVEMKEYVTFYFENGWDFLDETINGTLNAWGMNPAEHNGYPFLSMQGFTNAPDFEVITFSISSITGTGAALVGIAGKTSSTQHGFCWNTSGTPTTADTKVELGAVAQTGSYSSSINSLTPATTYYLRAFVIDDGVTYYGSQLSFGTIFWYGSGTSIDPYLIANTTDLRNLSEHAPHWSSHFKQTADISFIASDFESGGDFYNNGEGWIPIGNADTSFSGSYDGNEYSIDGLYINRPEAGFSQGFFGYSNSGSIKNVCLTAMNITAYSEIGGIVGWNNGEIDNCSTEGDIVGTGMTGGVVGGNNGTITNSSNSANISGTSNIGGLVGYSEAGSLNNSYNAGIVTGTEYVGGFIGNASSTAIDSCSNNGNVSGESYVGGLIGYLFNESSVGNSFNIGSVSGLVSVGGFAGYIDGSYTINNCYTKGDVTRSSGTSTSIGGFVGDNYGGTIDCCFSTGIVVYAFMTTGTVQFTRVVNPAGREQSAGGIEPSDKGFAGYDEGGTYNNNFFDATLSYQSSGVGATPKTTAEMKMQSTFIDAGWSSLVWSIDTEINGGYPYLSWQNPDGSPLPVELLSFTAAVNGGGVELTWETATETNNRGFEIERISDYLESVLSERSETKDGNQWQRIGFIEGHHTTNTPQEYSFTDNAARGILRYRLKQIDRDGKFAYSPIVEVKIAAPAVFALSQNYPNPFNPSTTISFTLQHTGLTTLKVYDAIGREVATLVNEVLEAGVYHQKQFNAGNLASGVYFARLTSGAQTQMKKLLLMK